MTSTLLLALVFSAPAPAPVKEKPPHPPRVLLVTSSTGLREFAYLQTMFTREMNKKRCELCVLLDKPREGGLGDLPPERILKRFPSQLNAIDRSKPDERFDVLAWYDLVVATDVAWEQMIAEDVTRLRRWVTDNGGGLVVVAGPIHFQKLHGLKGKDRDRVQPLLKLLPVVPGAAGEQKTDTPRRLTFPRAARDAAFLRLDNSEVPLSGWDRFFDEIQDEDGSAELPKKLPETPERGFFDCHPVISVKKEAKVLATFAHPKRRMPDGSEVPFLATMKSGKGQVVYVGSGEIWRLRFLQDTFHERFWQGLAKELTRR
jgi:hypothetical protein